MRCTSTACRAHPRSRGEHFVAGVFAPRFRGSSPLARGTRALQRPRRTCQGLIPARAGNTSPPVPVVPGCRAHPRSRGEHLSPLSPLKRRPGSSPLARGTPLESLVYQSWLGLIPARAGNTWRRWLRRFGFRAHPRSRGEHRVHRDSFSFMSGSSPLARGTQVIYHCFKLCLGLIPARAGNTPVYRRNFHPTGAHPRSRGEHSFLLLLLVSVQGSSPLARGTPPARGDRRAALGLIPARAGNTGGSARSSGGTGAHPRSRGEHDPNTATGLLPLGSSPLARGTLVDRDDDAIAVGLIPARAGNTYARRACPVAARAHPRSRGEHAGEMQPADYGQGSSPLARGTHLLTWGFTPYTSKIESLWSQSLHPEYTISNHY